MTMMQHNTDHVLFYGDSRNNMIRSKKKDGDDDESIMLVLVLLNYHLPRFTPILWDQGTFSLYFLFVSSSFCSLWVLTKKKEAEEEEEEKAAAAARIVIEI